MRKAIYFAAVIIAAAAFVSQARATEDQRDRLRREIAERARELRTLRDSGTTDNRSLDPRKKDSQRLSESTTNPFDQNNAFGAPMNLWSEGQSSAAAPTSKKVPPKTAQSVDLNGRPMASLQQRAPAPAGAKAGGGPASAPAAKKQVIESAAPVIAAAQTLFDNGEYGSARQMLLPIATSRIRAANEVTAAKNIIDKLDQLSKKLMAEAAALAAQGKVEQAAKIYSQVVTSFGGSPDAVIAAGKIVILKSTPDEAARYLLEQAKSNLEKNRIDVSLPLLQELIALYPNTAQSAAAQDIIKQLQAQQAASRLSEDQVMTARKYLIVGDIHAVNGRKSEAIDSYNRVIRDFEDTRFADLAREKLATITEKKDK